MATALPLSPLNLPEMESRGCSVASFIATLIIVECPSIVYENMATVLPLSPS